MAATDAAVIEDADAGAVVRTGSPLFQTTPAGLIVEWNRSAETLSGIPSCDALGRTCWEVIRGRDGAGRLVCHRGCSVPRLAREGSPVRGTDLRVRMPSGVARLTISTIVVGAGDDAFVLHPMQVLGDEAEPTVRPKAPELTPGQLRILTLLVDGLCAKEIATHLALSVSTVRNHIQAVLRRLGVNSQLAAVAKARELGLCEPPYRR